MRAPARAALTGLALAPLLACGGRVSKPLLADPAPVFRGHQELDVSVERDPVPRVLGTPGPVGVCLEVPLGTDTSQWEARLFPGQEFAPPATRLDTTVCFEGELPDAPPRASSALCAELRDRFDGRTQSLPCLPYRLEREDRVLRALEAEIPSALPSPAALDGLRERARRAGLPALALRLELIAAYGLRRQGAPASQAAAAERLARAPSWAGEPAAARWGGQLAYERAMLRLEAEGDLAGSWSLLRVAERRFRLGGDRKWIAAATKQAEILSRAGSSGEAKERLRFALEQCSAAPCDGALVRAAQNTLAWLVVSDPDAGDAELRSAESALGDLVAADAAPADPLERANLLLNLALVRQRLGRAVDPPLAQARALLAHGETARARELLGWAELVEGRRALGAGQGARAVEVGERLGDSAVSARLRAFGLSCAAAAHRAQGALPLAADRLARALALQAGPRGKPLEQDVPLGPGQRAEDAYAAARVALESARPSLAWSILRHLDDEAGSPAPLPQDLATWLRTLADLETPSSAARRRDQRAQRRHALDLAQERVRARGNGSAAAEDDAVLFRAFPLEDEVVVLRRAPSGEVTVYRRTPLSRRRLVAAVRALGEAIEREEGNDARWAALAEPLAEALVPRPRDLPAVTTFAMHGILQEVPLAALPVPGLAGRRWLAEVTTVAWHPAGSARPAEQAGTGAGPAVFVLDPRGDLGVRLEGQGREARVFRGEDARRAAVRAALAGARSLHVEAHARYEPAFPELSTILLADGPVTGQELAGWTSGLALANLSGCGTGRSPVTADSGRFGMSGLLARQGVPWVVGTRAALHNDLARTFNRALVAALAQGISVPGAYERALALVRARHPASRWAVLLLLRGSGGQSPAPRTPSPMEGSP